MRTLRWILVPALTLLVAGAAYACDKEKASAQASTKNASVTSKASAEGCGAAKTAGVQQVSTGAGCTAAEKAACEAKKANMASADHCPFCTLAGEIRAQKGKVSFSTVQGKEGITMVFAAVSQDDVAQAQAMANKAYALLNKPAHCSYSSAQMADKSCGDCKDGLTVVSHAAITLENTKKGAEAIVKPAKPEEMEKLQAFFHNLEAEVVKVEG